MKKTLPFFSNLIPEQREQPPSDDSLSSREPRSTLASPQPRQPTSPHPGPDPSSAPPARLCLSLSSRSFPSSLDSTSSYLTLCLGLPPLLGFPSLPVGLSVFHSVLWHWIAKSESTEGHSLDSAVCILKLRDSGRKIMMALFMSLSERRR